MTAVQPMNTFNMNGRTTVGNVTLTIQPSTSATPVPPRGRFMNPGSAFQMGMTEMMGDGPGRRLRKNVANVRRHVDYVSTVLNHTETRLWQYGRQKVIQQPDVLYQNAALPVHCTMDTPIDCILTKFIRTAMNKVKCPVYSLCWSPEGKRLITGTQTGEFTLWNGTAFNFETILQAHDTAIRALKWSSNEQWLLSADQEGYVKYWQPNMNNAHMFSAHKEEAIRGITFAPTDLKFATASDDGTARIWDFARYTEDRVLRGHGSEVRCIDWHPTKGLIVTGSRDTQQPVKLWDPKSGSCLATLQEHKSSVMSVEFNKNGNWLLTGGRDHLIKMYDIRMMKEVHTYRAHKKEVISVAWHPVHEGLFVSGGGDGSIVYWLVDSEKEIGLLEHAHDQAIWAMRWHPLGHILATGSNDNNTKFWSRNRPGDTVEDIFGLSASTMIGHLDKEREPRLNPKIMSEESAVFKSDIFIPGMGLDEELYEQLNRDAHIGSDSTLLVPDDVTRTFTGPMIGAKRTLIKQPPAKKAQRQFERMWNSSKGIGAGTDDFATVIGGMGREDADGDAEQLRSHKTSLLGTPSTPSLLGPPSTGGSLLGPSQPKPPTVNNPLPPPADYNNVPPPSEKRPMSSSWRNPMQNQSHQHHQQSNYIPKPNIDRIPNMERTPNMAPVKAPDVVPPALPPGIKFDKNGMPIIPPGLPPHLWPMPPGMKPPPPVMNQKPPGGDIDYRSAPGPSGAAAPTPNLGSDVDFRSMPPMIPPPRSQVSQQNDSWRGAASPTPRGPPPPMMRGPPPPLQQRQPLNDPRADPRSDPRLLMKDGPNIPEIPQRDGALPPIPPASSSVPHWMPQFENGGNPAQPPPPQPMGVGRGGPIRTLPPNARQQASNGPPPRGGGRNPPY